jgi:hypothetical protein
VSFRSDRDALYRLDFRRHGGDGERGRHGEARGAPRGLLPEENGPGGDPFDGRQPPNRRQHRQTSRHHQSVRRGAALAQGSPRAETASERHQGGDGRRRRQRQPRPGPGRRWHGDRRRDGRRRRGGQRRTYEERSLGRGGVSGAVEEDGQQDTTQLHVRQHLQSSR